MLTSHHPEVARRPDAALAELRSQVLVWEGSVPAEGRLVRPACDGLAKLLGGGWRQGSLVEWLSPEGDQGALLALAAAREITPAGGALVVCDRAGVFYPPAAIASGWSWDELVLIRGVDPREELWALEQALRSPAVAVAWGRVDELAPRDFRRLQLAAEEGSAVGFLFRPERVRGSPSWSHVQLGVRSAVSASSGGEQRRWRVEVLRRRGGTAGDAIELELTERGALCETTHGPTAHPLPPLAALARAAAQRHSA